MEEQLAVVTGASSGIGAELSRRLCRMGWRVIGAARSADKLNALREELGECFTPLTVDLADPSSLERITAAVEEHGGRLGLLVNNAGYAIAKPLHMHTPRELEDIFLVDAIRPIQLTIRLLEYMPRGSTIVNVITAGVHVRMRSLPSYGAAKIALMYASMMLREELEEKGIHLIEVYPGPVKTRFFERAGMKTPKWASTPEKVAEEIIKAIEKRKKTVYIPAPLAILRPLSTPLPIYF
ncbi:MAG: SDR family NAD(P)-dependent oxidoreductase [Crenarchaeota archaeon]|nr:SDR family NAD(P)-dependent oxidoreductase [Thermoproteota archaeon]